MRLRPPNPALPNDKFYNSCRPAAFRFCQRTATQSTASNAANPRLFSSSLCSFREHPAQAEFNIKKHEEYASVKIRQMKQRRNISNSNCRHPPTAATPPTSVYRQHAGRFAGSSRRYSAASCSEKQQNTTRSNCGQTGSIPSTVRTAVSAASRSG